MNPSHEQSRFREMVRTLRQVLVDEKECLYFLHTPVGLINVSRWSYHVPGFVFVMGDDERGEFRFIGFTDEQICAFPFEVKRKSVLRKGSEIGFIRDLDKASEDRVDKSE